MVIDQLRESYLSRFPAEAARVLEKSPALAGELGELSTPSLVSMLERVDPGYLQALFQALPFEKQAEILESCSIRAALLILRSLSAGDREKLLEELPSIVGNELSSLINFPEGTAGRYMDRPVATFRPDMTVGESLERLKQTERRGLRSLYLSDEDNVLAGRVDLQDMALAEHDELMSTLMQPVEGIAYLTSPEEDLVKIFDEFRVDSVPIVDQDLKLTGVVRYQNLFQAAEDAASADIQKMVGVRADERALSRPGFAVKRRLPWLHINLVTAFVAAAVVGLFENIIAQFTALAILLPVVAGQSGNAGSQALAVTMRGLALKEISVLHWRPVLTKEVIVGVIDGLALAVTCGLGVLLWSQSLGLALVIGIAMIISLIAAGIAGALVPVVLIRLGQDPATASSIILTTVTDVAGFFSFLGTATLLSFLL
ncbi:MAG: magnesium transporter [Pseudomonadales bacterium]|nr:magnesium transporter [Pseudomonadales bacterium]